MMLHVDGAARAAAGSTRTTRSTISLSQRAAAFRVVCVGISADGRGGHRFNGDGVIARRRPARPAYGLSAGGPVIEPSAENMAVIPICAMRWRRSRSYSRPSARVVHHAQPARAAAGVHLGGRRTGLRRAAGPVGCIHHPLRRCSTRLIRLKGQQLLPNTTAQKL
ncbi:MAG: hypothetical protein ACLR4Z_07730 [Butyricicoccaceae bacterium]